MMGLTRSQIETLAEVSDRNTGDLTLWKLFYFSYYIYINTFLLIVLLLNSLGWSKWLGVYVCVLKGRQAGNLEKVYYLETVSFP